MHSWQCPIYDGTLETLTGAKMSDSEIVYSFMFTYCFSSASFKHVLRIAKVTFVEIQQMKKKHCK